jgi:hypothetical protein
MITVKYSRWVLVFSLIISFFVLVGCNPGGSDYGSQLDISLDVQELTLIQLWGTIVEEIGIREETAKISSFTLVTNAHGEIQWMLFEVWGISAENLSTSYLVEINNRENQRLLTVNTYISDTSLNSSHPGAYFDEIDKVGLPSIQSDTDGIWISIDDMFPGGDYHSNEKVSLLFRLKDGNLVPLKRVKFRDEPYIFGIKVKKKAPDGEPFYPSEIWFLDQDMAKAEIIEYQ